MWPPYPFLFQLYAMSKYEAKAEIFNPILLNQTYWTQHFLSHHFLSMDDDLAWNQVSSSLTVFARRSSNSNNIVSFYRGRQAGAELCQAQAS